MCLVITLKPKKGLRKIRCPLPGGGGVLRSPGVTAEKSPVCSLPPSHKRKKKVYLKVLVGQCSWRKAVAHQKALGSYVPIYKVKNYQGCWQRPVLGVFNFL